MKIKLPTYLIGSWLLSLTLFLAMSVPILGQSEMKMDAQIEAERAGQSFAPSEMKTDVQKEAERTRQQISSPFQTINGQASNRPMAFPDPYCEITGFSSVEAITRVLFSDIDNTSDVNSTSAHEDFTSVVGNVDAGETYTFTLEGYTGGNFSNYVIAWVDWDQDGVFDETTERYDIGVIQNSSGGDGVQVSADIEVPADALAGQTRMRVMKRFGSTPGSATSCAGATSWGQAEDYTVEVGGGGGAGGETCDAPIVVTALPFDDAGNTADYGDNYSSGDVPPVATDAVTNGTGSSSYLNGDDVVYAYTPADDEVLNISTTNDNDWIGLWAFTGCPFTSTVGYHTSTSGDTRLIEELPVTAGETYYFVISTWAPPESTDYTILIERVGGTPPGGDCSLATEGVFENGKSFTKNLDRVVANDIVVPAGQNMLLEKINLNAFIGGVGSGVTAADVDVYVYEDNSGMPGALVTMIPDVVPTSQTIIGDAFGFQAYDVEIDFAAVNLPGQESAETTYWIGASLDATDGSNVFWEFYSNATAPVVGHGIAYDDGIVGFIIESDNEGVYTFHATCSDIGGGGSDCISTLYSGGNNGSPGGAVYFDITVGPEDIELTSIDLNTDLAGTGFSVDVYTIDGTYVGNETNQGAWTMRTSGSGTSAGEGSPSTATLDDTFVLSANTTYGMALVLDSTHRHYYTNGNGTNEHYENDDLELDLGSTTNTPFDGTVFTPRVFNGGLCYNVGGGGTGDDCDQGDDSNGFENGYNITAGGTFRNADDFIVSAGNTLNVRSIVLNVFANEPVSSVNINFFEDDGGMPGSTIVESVSGLVPYAQVPIGSNFGYTIYGVYLEVDLNFAGGASGASYWMQPEAVTDVAFWEVTSLGSLGELIHTSEAMGPWMPDEDGVNHAVFKLHCEVVTAPDPGCLFDITASVEPITRVVLAGIDNTSSAVVNGSPALEDFTHIEGTMGQGTEYDIALEGNTDGNWTNYFTVWIDWDQNGVWEADEMYEIGSITNSTGTDGQQATGTITVPADAPLGSTTMRVIKSFGSSPTDPCGQYSFGQGEDYTIIVEEGVGIDDQSMTTFTYYPNPTSGIVNITANKDISSVSVVNILGQQVIATKSLDNGQVDLSALATGTYMFRVTFEDGSLETFKVLKE